MSRVGILLQRSRSTHAAEYSRSGARAERYMEYARSGPRTQWSTHVAGHARSRARSERYAAPSRSSQVSLDVRSRRAGRARTQRSTHAAEHARCAGRTQQSMHAAERYVASHLYLSEPGFAVRTPGARGSSAARTQEQQITHAAEHPRTGAGRGCSLRSWSLTMLRPPESDLSERCEDRGRGGGHASALQSPGKHGGCWSRWREAGGVCPGGRAGPASASMEGPHTPVHVSPDCMCLWE